ncbi:MAG: hypothetical protein KIS77_18070 [Saprospiraceae bacterium]|nr:hypothetical protein [Saprospiraceae bacterium]
MKKILLHLICWGILCQNLLGQPVTRQSLLQHAIGIREFAVPNGPGRFKLKDDEASTGEYLARLFAATGLPPESKKKNLLDALDGNPYLADELDGPIVGISNNLQDLGSLTRGQTYAAPAPTVSGFSPTAVADGLAKFLVARTKEELSIVFFRDFQDEMRRNTALNTLFPSTAAVLDLIGERIYQYNLYLESMRESFDKDMKVLPLNLKAYLTNTQFIRSEKYQILAEDALDLSQLFLDGMSPDSIIAHLAMQSAVQQPTRRASVLDPTDQQQLTDLAAGLRTLHLLSESLRSDDDTQIWLPAKKVSAALRDEAVLNIYLGLLWHHGHRIQFSDGASVRDKLGGIARNTGPMRDCLRDFAQHAEDTRIGLRNSYRRGPDDDMRYEQQFRFFDPFFKLLQTGMRFKTQVAGYTGASTRTDTIFLKSLQHLNDLNLDIRRKHYAAAVNDLLFVFDQLAPAFEHRDKVFKYGHFIAAVAAADNSDQIAAAIEAVALPPGSSRVKKQNHFSVAINAYTGVTAGSEHLQGFGGKPFVALSAPLGFSASWGLGLESGKKIGSITLYAPLIDVGALVAFRFDDPFSNNLPELEWGNLLSPGLYLAYGFFNELPFTFGIGAQRGPNLRKVSTGTGDINVSGWRVGAFFAVDIPLFNLYVKPRQRRN